MLNRYQKHRSTTASNKIVAPQFGSRQVFLEVKNETQPHPHYSAQGDRTAAFRTFPLTIRGGKTIIFTIAYAKACAKIPILAFPFTLNSFVIHTHLFLAYSARIITHSQKARKTAIQEVWQAKGPFFSRSMVSGKKMPLTIELNT